MSEDSRSAKPRKYLYVANPDSDDLFPPSRLYSAMRPPLPSSPFPYHRPTPSHPPEVLLPNLSLPYPQPPLSPDSTGSPSTSTPPPTTPAHSHSTSVDLQPRLDSPSKPLPTPEQIVYQEQPPPQTRSRKFFTNLKAPFGGRPKPADSSARKHHRTSPTAATPDSTVVSASSSSPERVIFVTSDRERYVTVDISSAKNALQIRELILTKLNIYNDDELFPYAIYKTEIGSFAIGEALSNERLFNLCRDLGDAKGNLKFYVSQSPVNNSSAPSLEHSSIPHVLPPLPATNPLRIKRRTSRSRNGSVSSTSESTPLEGGYDADGENPQQRETSRPPARTSQSQGAPVTSEHPPSPPRRPSLPQYPRSSSPRSSQPDPLPQPPQPSQLFDWQRSSRKDEKYGHAPLPPIPTGSHSLSPNRPSFPLNEDTPSLSVTQDRHVHSRSVSDAAPEQLHTPKPAEPQPQSTDSLLRPMRSRENPSLTKLRPELSRDNMRGERAAKQYDEDDNSWEIVMPTMRPTDEPSPLSRSRQPNRYNNKPTSPFNARHNAYGPSRPTPSSVSTTTLPLQSEPPRPAMQNQLRAGRWPVHPNVLVSWKGEEGSSRKPSQTSTANPASSWQNSNRLNKSTTKSMDSLRTLNHTAARRNPPPALPVLTRPQTSPYSPNGLTNTNLSISGIPKSYEPPRTGMVRPLPHGPSASDYHPSSSSGHYSTRGHGSSSLVSLNHEPYPRPQSAAGDATYSPSSSRRMQSPIYGSNLDSGEFSRSPRTVSPSRPFHSPGIGIPGPRPRPNHHSDRSDRSSASGPETVNTSPPHTPISPQSSTRYESSENGNAVADLSPPSSPDTSPYGRETGSDLTLKQEDQAALKEMLNGWDQETYVSKAPAQQTKSISPPIPENNFSTDSYLADDDEEEGGSGGTWIVRPEPMQAPSRPPLTVHIENPTNPPSPDIGSSTTQATARPAVPPKDPPPSSYRPPPTTRLLSTMGRPESTFIDPEGDNWARPPPENIYEHLEKFFPTHDLDKPVIEATASGDTSPTSSAPPSGMIPPPIPVNDAKTAKMKAKKSIRIVAQEHRKLIDRTSRAAEHTAYADNMKRKRSTKLWGSKLEEVTTARSASSSSLPESPSSGPGPTTFKWVRGELIGKGTYGRVYLALNATTGEMIAVKQVELPQTPSDKNDSRQHTVVQALKMESETLRDLDHPHVVQYLGFEETPTNLSIFLEYVPGGSVGSCLHKHGRFNDNVTRSFTAQILSGLEYLHSKGILHRDLKADNILVEMSGTCKISDFGISKRTEDLQGGAFTAMQGTVFWMAPEVINTQGKGYNFKIDIWSVGCVVLEMWAGIRPWSGEEMVAVMFKLYQSKQPPPVPEDITPLLPEADDFRLKCFAINPDERPSAAELRKHPYLILPPGWVFTEFT